MRRQSVAETAYVLIQTEVGKAAQVATKIAKIDGIVGADDVTGPYDVIARAEAGTLDELGKMAVSKVQLIDGPTRTVTRPVVLRWQWLLRRRAWPRSRRSPAAGRAPSAAGGPAPRTLHR